MNTPKNLNPKVHVKFEPMKASDVTKANDFFRGYMNGKYNFIKLRDRRYIMKDKIDKEAKQTREKLLEEIKIRDIVEEVLEEKKQEEQNNNEELNEDIIEENDSNEELNEDVIEDNDSNEELNEEINEEKINEEGTENA